MITIEMSPETYQDMINLQNGLFKPLNGFMDKKNFKSVVENVVLSTGEPWTIPIALETSKEDFSAAAKSDMINLSYMGENVAELTVTDGFTVTDDDIQALYKTLDNQHPGVQKERQRGKYRIGGKVTVIKSEILNTSLNAEKLKSKFKAHGWKTVAGFQTRNPIHRAHEHLQRVALDICDGLFINPIVGWKKIGDFSEQAVIAGYNRMIDEFYPKDRVHMEGLRTQMRYAGPREAIFHAIIRRNLGCTHFIIGRDHAGVGGYYGTYEAHELARSVTSNADLGISLLLLREPYWCEKCGQIVSDSTCAHSETHKLEISGTIIRNGLSTGIHPDGRMMRPEIAESIISLKEKIFINGEDFEK